jgi:acetyl esterase
MAISWARSSPEELRTHHASEAEAMAGDLSEDVVETALAEEGAFRGGLLFTPPACSKDALFVYFHGGGFVAGTPESHRCVTAWLAKLSGMRVLSARYRLAPEHRFPAQREDAIAACLSAVALSEAPAEETRIVLAGDSAGACVALWGLRALDSRIRACVKGLVLFYGGYGLIESDSIAKHGTPDSGLDSNTLSIMYRRLGELGPASGGSIWPLDFASEITEPAYVLAGEFDPMFDDSAKLFQRLGGAGARHEFVVVEGQGHGFFKETGKDPVAMRELEKAARWAAALADRG